jgi:hypothetical protein
MKTFILSLLLVPVLLYGGAIVLFATLQHVKIELPTPN